MMSASAVVIVAIITHFLDVTCANRRGAPVARGDELWVRHDGARAPPRGLTRGLDFINGAR
jgi:hypothetical protein